MADPIEIWTDRATAITVDLGEVQPSGVTFESQVRATADPDSALLATWAVDDSAADTTGGLTLTVASITDPLPTRRGKMDIVRIDGPGLPVVVMPPTDVVFRDGPTVP